jgi:hypothetical protein
MRRLIPSLAIAVFLSSMIYFAAWLKGTPPEEMHGIMAILAGTWFLAHLADITHRNDILEDDVDELTQRIVKLEKADSNTPESRT